MLACGFLWWAIALHKVSQPLSATRNETHFSETEIYQNASFALIIIQEVCRFHITMNNTPLMDVFEGSEEVTHI